MFACVRVRVCACVRAYVYLHVFIFLLVTPMHTRTKTHPHPHPSPSPLPSPAHAHTHTGRLTASEESRLHSPTERRRLLDALGHTGEPHAGESSRMLAQLCDKDQCARPPRGHRGREMGVMGARRRGGGGGGGKTSAPVIFHSEGLRYPPSPLSLPLSPPLIHICTHMHTH